MKEFLTDAQVEQEIARLMESEAVRLARKEMRVKYRRRQYMYGLRNLEKRGKELMTQGVTIEGLDRLDIEEEE